MCEKFPIRTGPARELWPVPSRGTYIDWHNDFSRSKSTCQSGLYALRWSTVLAEGALRGDDAGVDYEALVLAQANLLAAVVAYGDKRQSEKAFSKVALRFQQIFQTDRAEFL